MNNFEGKKLVEEPALKKELNLGAEFERRGIKNDAEFTYSDGKFQILSCGPNGICYSKDGTLIKAKWTKRA